MSEVQRSIPDYADLIEDEGIVSRGLVAVMSSPPIAGRDGCGQTCGFPPSAVDVSNQLGARLGCVFPETYQQSQSVFRVEQQLATHSRPQCTRCGQEGREERGVGGEGSIFTAVSALSRAEVEGACMWGFSTSQLQDVLSTWGSSSGGDLTAGRRQEGMERSSSVCWPG